MNWLWFFAIPDWWTGKLIFVLTILEEQLPLSSLVYRYLVWDPCSASCSSTPFHPSLGLETCLSSYVLQMASTLVVRSKYGSNCISVYSPNTLARWGLMMWTAAAMSRTTIHRSLSSCWSSSRTRHTWKTTQEAFLDPTVMEVRADFRIWKKSSRPTSALGRACSDKDIFVMRAVFAFEDPNLSVPFFRSVGGLLVNVNSSDLWLCERKCPRHPLWYLVSFFSIVKAIPEPSSKHCKLTPRGKGISLSTKAFSSSSRVWYAAR